MAFSFLSLLMLGLIVLVGAIVAGLFYGRRRARNEADSLVCGACGYPVRGMTALNCPECGADLRVAGIVRPTRRGGLSVAMLIVLGFIFVVMLLGAVSFLLVAMPSRGLPAATSSYGPHAPASTTANPGPSSPPSDRSTQNPPDPASALPSASPASSPTPSPAP